MVHKTRIAKRRRAARYWYCKFLSVVTKTSKSASSAAARRAPFCSVAQPRSYAVSTLGPAKCSTQWRWRSLIEQDFQSDLRGSGEATARVFEDGVNLFAADAGEPGEKLWYRGAPFKVLEQGSHRDASSAEEPFSADPSGHTLNRGARGPIKHA